MRKIQRGQIILSGFGFSSKDLNISVEKWVEMGEIEGFSGVASMKGFMCRF